MLRFPNPGSTLENFIKIFVNLSNNLSDYIFTLDDMVSITVNKGLASSSGFIGNEAIIQSTRKDRSRDPLYNQLKINLLLTLNIHLFENYFSRRYLKRLLDQLPHLFQ